MAKGYSINGLKDALESGEIIAGNADTLDSLHSTSFARLDDTAIQTFSGNMRIGLPSTLEGGALIFKSNTTSGLSEYYIDTYGNGSAGSQYFRLVQRDASNVSKTLNFPQVSGTVWSSGNDGAGSGLDADLLDGLQPSTSSTASTIAQRDIWGNITARLFRSEYDVTNSNIGFIMTQVNTDDDNYIRPSTPAQVASALGMDSALTDAGHSFTGNGYQKFSNGLILQWGSFSARANQISSVSFPVTFPSACLFANMNMQRGPGNAYTKRVESLSRTALGYSIDSFGSANPIVTHFWWALGY